MYMNPNLMDHMTKDHQRQLLREAEMDRLASQARMEQPSLMLRLRRLASELLSRMSRGGQPRTPSDREKLGALSASYRRGPTSAHMS